jgi:hypothetical protein
MQLLRTANACMIKFISGTGVIVKSGATFVCAGGGNMIIKKHFSCGSTCMGADSLELLGRTAAVCGLFGVEIMAGIQWSVAVKK